MKSDRTARNLAALQNSASTSRVLNLLAVFREKSDLPEHAAQPFFADKVLNSSVVLKHRLRSDETYLFEEPRGTATKIIIPFDRADLRLGGRSFFVGQRGWLDSLTEISGGARMERDIDLLTLIDKLPSLDPFLLRERLRQSGYRVATCYFALSPADIQRMRTFVAEQIGQLIALAYQGVAPRGGEVQHGKLVEALLSTEVDDRLEPLRQTLMLDGEDYREGIFCWKGFLYYKWSLTILWPQLRSVAEEISKLSVIGPRDREMLAYVEEARYRLQQRILFQRAEIQRILKIYDDAFEMMTRNGKPAHFVDFLLKAPQLFLDLGEKAGFVSHIASFWRYRFPANEPLRAPVEEIFEIFQEFETGLSNQLAA